MTEIELLEKLTTTAAKATKLKHYLSTTPANEHGRAVCFIGHDGFCLTSFRLINNQFTIWMRSEVLSFDLADPNFDVNSAAFAKHLRDRVTANFGHTL